MTRNVIVTGGGTGIGRAVAKAFAADGDNVLIVGRRREPLQTTATGLGKRVSTAACDVSDPAQVDQLRSQLPASVDVLVHCAGGNTDFDRAAVSDLASLAANWKANLDANLTSAALMAAVVEDRLAEGARVITIGSIAADKGAGAYGASKAGLASWNVQLSAQLGPRGITANVISPGYIAETEFFRDNLDDERRDALIAATHTKRAGVPADIAATARFLASPEARQITGQVVAVNGGEHTTR